MYKIRQYGYNNSRHRLNCCHPRTDVLGRPYRLISIGSFSIQNFFQNFFQNE